MKRSNKLFHFALLSLATTGAALPAQAATIASFADPGSVSFLFADDGSNNNGIGYLTAANNDITVLLPHLGLTFTNASYMLTNSNGGTLATTTQTDIGGLIRADFESGYLTIITDIAQNSLQAGDVILRAAFDSATGVFGNVFAADDFMGNDVVYSGFAVNGYATDNESFAFSATNFQPSILPLMSPADMENWSATASFTASADIAPVPLPAAGILLMSGIAGLGLRTRRRT